VGALFFFWAGWVSVESSLFRGLDCAQFIVCPAKIREQEQKHTGEVWGNMAAGREKAVEDGVFAWRAKYAEIVLSAL